MLTRPHVPYRNSLLTAMLKDSLGGNCATAMLATISSEGTQLEESIATCRFAQRVAMITNEVGDICMLATPGGQMGNYVGDAVANMDKRVSGTCVCR